MLRGASERNGPVCPRTVLQRSAGAEPGKERSIRSSKIVVKFRFKGCGAGINLV